jgi:uncharacterized protein (TIGR02391 family)
MAQRQPLTKAELKKMVLQVMYELKYGRMSNYASGMDSIIPYWINEYYSIQLTKEEKVLALDAVKELKVDGLIVKDVSKDDDVFQVLTEKGTETATGHPATEPKTQTVAHTESAVCTLKLEDAVTNPDLLEACQSSFNEGDYKTAILKAFRFLETKVSVAAKLTSHDVGTVLMAKAFSPSIGKLALTPDATIEEEDGVYNLFSGAIALFGNPDSHLSIDYGDRLKAIGIIAFSEILLDILSKAQLKP